MKTKIVVIGGKGTAVVIAEQIYDAENKFGTKVEMLGFAFDDDSFGSEINGFPVLCKTTEAKKKYEGYNDVKFIYSLYRTDKTIERIKLLKSYRIPLEKFYTFIHPSAYVAKSAVIGKGCAILANTVVNSNVKICNHVIINSSCLVGHDSEIGDNCFFGGHSCLGSDLKIGKGVVVGLNASIRNFLIIGDYAIVGMHSNVVKNVDEKQMVIGNPARPKTVLNNPY